MIAAIVIVVAFFGLFFAWPVVTMVARGLIGESGLGWSGAWEVLTRDRTVRVIGQTLAQATVATAVAVGTGVPGAYVLYRLRFSGQRLARSLILVPFVMPTIVVGVAFRTLLAENGPLGWLGLDGSFFAIAAALVFFNYAVVVRVVGSMWANLDPRREQAAAALGAGRARVFLTVTLPALMPALCSAAAMVFLFCSTAFGVVLTLGGLRYGTVETEIWTLTTQYLDLRGAAVLSVLQLIIVFLVLTAANAARSRQEDSWQSARTEVAQRVPRRGDLPAIVVTVVMIAGLLLTPILGLVVRSFQTPQGWGFDNYVALVGAAGIVPVSVMESLGQSLRIAVDATVISVVLGVVMAVVLSRRSRRGWVRSAINGFDALLMLPLGVSAVTVGFGLLITMTGPPLDLANSAVLIPVAQAMVAIPLVVRAVLPALRGIDRHQREAAAVLGAGPIRSLLSVEGPVVARVMPVALGFAFAASLGEFGATSFLARPGAPTLPVVIYRLISHPGQLNAGMAMAGAVILAAVTVVVMVASEQLRERGLPNTQGVML